MASFQVAKIDDKELGEVFFISRTGSTWYEVSADPRKVSEADVIALLARSEPDKMTKAGSLFPLGIATRQMRLWKATFFDSEN